MIIFFCKMDGHFKQFRLYSPMWEMLALTSLKIGDPRQHRAVRSEWKFPLKHSSRKWTVTRRNSTAQTRSAWWNDARQAGHGIMTLPMLLAFETIMQRRHCTRYLCTIIGRDTMWDRCPMDGNRWWKTSCHKQSWPTEWQPERLLPILPIYFWYSWKANISNAFKWCMF